MLVMSLPATCDWVLHEQKGWDRGRRVGASKSCKEHLSTIKDWDLLHQKHFGVVFAGLLCSAGITNENEFQFSDSPTPLVSNDVTFGHAHTLCSAIWLLY